MLQPDKLCFHNLKWRLCVESPRTGELGGVWSMFHMTKTVGIEGQKQNLMSCCPRRLLVGLLE